MGKKLKRKITFKKICLSRKSFTSNLQSTSIIKVKYNTFHYISIIQFRLL